MLKKGVFIKEPLPEIGRHWTYSLIYRNKTEEEKFIEAVLRGERVKTETRFERLIFLILKF